MRTRQGIAACGVLTLAVCAASLVGSLRWAEAVAAAPREITAAPSEVAAARSWVAATRSWVAAAPPVDFKREIEPLFKAHCIRCHGPDEQRSGYRLDSKDAAFRGGETGEAAIVAGDADNSPLVQYIRGDDADFVMPPEGERLSAAEVERIVRWIDEGAKWSAR